MASYKQVRNGYQVQVAIRGVRKSASFRTKREAVAWASALETEIRANDGKPVGNKKTLADALQKYSNEVSPSKRGCRWEQIRIKAFMNSALPVGELIHEVTPAMIALWRDDRLRSVGNGTVLREIGLLSAVFEQARLEWGWVKSNPVTDIRKPRQPDHRETLLTRHQIKLQLHALGYSPLIPIRSVSQSIAVAFLLALRSGMRAGEICGLTWARVHDGYCQTPHKTGNTALSMRDVPLTTKALRLINKMRGFDPVTVFGVKVNTLDTLFRRARDRAGLSGFVFHDTRHTAATWLAQDLHVLDLCKAFGWSNTTRALTYYNPKASDIAKRIGQPRRGLERY